MRLFGPQALPAVDFLLEIREALATLIKVIELATERFEVTGELLWSNTMFSGKSVSQIESSLHLAKALWV